MENDIRESEEYKDVKFEVALAKAGDTVTMSRSLATKLFLIAEVFEDLKIPEDDTPRT